MLLDFTAYNNVAYFTIRTNEACWSRKPDALYKPEYYADRHNKGFE